MAVEMHGSAGMVPRAATSLTPDRKEFFDGYEPQIGDVWAIQVHVEPGTLVVGPAGWTRSHETREEQVQGRTMEAQLWWWVLTCDGEDAKSRIPTVRFSRHGFAQLGIVAYRPPIGALATDSASAVPTLREITGE